MAQTRTRTFNLINTNYKKLNERNYEISSIYSSKASPPSLEDSHETLQSCSDDSLISDKYEIRSNNHYVKHSKLNQNTDHITSLKRRVRKQQLRHEQNQTTAFQLPSSPNVFLISYSQPPVTSCHYRTKKSSCVVPLPPLIHNSRTVRTHAHGINLNMYGY